MISHLKGTIKEINKDDSIILDVGGVGYDICCTEQDLSEFANNVGNEVELYTHYYLRENAAELYGFKDKNAREMFKVLIGISGIGPKAAINVLGASSLDTLKRSIAEGDSSVLTSVSGIGNRIAQKITVELQDKFEEDWGASGGDVYSKGEAVEALESLGYSKKEARDALRSVPDDIESTESKVKEALKLLGNNN